MMTNSRRSGQWFHVLQRRSNYAKQKKEENIPAIKLLGLTYKSLTIVTYDVTMVSTKVENGLQSLESKLE